MKNRFLGEINEFEKEQRDAYNNGGGASTKPKGYGKLD